MRKKHRELLEGAERMTEQEKREKVIKGLECIAGNLVYCAHCKYSDVNGYGRGDRCKRDCAKDALALLKAQEPMEPKWRKGYAYCGQCGYKLHWIVEQNNFCQNCGRAVKWE